MLFKKKELKEREREWNNKISTDPKIRKMRFGIHLFHLVLSLLVVRSESQRGKLTFALWTTGKRHGWQKKNQ